MKIKNKEAEAVNNGLIYFGSIEHNPFWRKTDQNKNAFAPLFNISNAEKNAIYMRHCQKNEDGTSKVTVENGETKLSFGPEVREAFLKDFNEWADEEFEVEFKTLPVSAIENMPLTQDRISALIGKMFIEDEVQV